MKSYFQIRSPWHTLKVKSQFKHEKNELFPKLSIFFSSKWLTQSPQARYNTYLYLVQCFLEIAKSVSFLVTSLIMFMTLNFINSHLMHVRSHLVLPFHPIRSFCPVIPHDITTPRPITFRSSACFFAMSCEK